ncbi:DUF4253 domain-containing protein [Kribbella sp. NPDC056345]|uniref:DUF4253 domain-containing protein n=1 Tax=Kribbella sp. NPDC056345 TaxID=3345789 RepID=UPI0035E32450
MTEGTVMTDLFADLPADLPPGSPIGPEDGPPTAWLSDDEWDSDLHRRLLADFPRTGWYPVLVDERAVDSWTEGELAPQPVAEIDRYDAAAVMAELWAENVAEQASYDISLEPLEPFGEACPGLAPSLDSSGIDEVVDSYLAGFEADDGDRLLLAKVARGADLPAVLGWQGDVDLPKVLTMLRSWEDRFGARLVVLGFDSMRVITMPTEDVGQLQLMAAEQWAFDPDWINQEVETLEAQVETMSGDPEWLFWWD